MKEKTRLKTNCYQNTQPCRTVEGARRPSLPEKQGGEGINSPERMVLCGPWQAPTCTVLGAVTVLYSNVRQFFTLWPSFRLFLTPSFRFYTPLHPAFQANQVHQLSLPYLCLPLVFFSVSLPPGIHPSASLSPSLSPSSLLYHLLNLIIPLLLSLLLHFSTTWYPSLCLFVSLSLSAFCFLLLHFSTTYGISYQTTQRSCSRFERTSTLRIHAIPGASTSCGAFLFFFSFFVLLLNGRYILFLMSFDLWSQEYWYLRRHVKRTHQPKAL